MGKKLLDSNVALEWSVVKELILSTATNVIDYAYSISSLRSMVPDSSKDDLLGPSIIDQYRNKKCDTKTTVENCILRIREGGEGLDELVRLLPYVWMDRKLNWEEYNAIFCRGNEFIQKERV